MKKVSIILICILLILLSICLCACNENETTSNLSNQDQEQSSSGGEKTPSGSKMYTVTWKNWDGSILKREERSSGSTPSYSGTPTKPNEGEYTYTFSGWDPQPTKITGNATYIAQYDFDNRFLEYEYDNKLNGYSIISYSGASTSIKIPSKHDNKPVVSIGYEAFKGKTALANVEFSNSLKTIEDYAFQNCTGLVDVDLADSIEYLGSGAFLGCSNLMYVELPDGLVDEGDYYPPFYNCDKLVCNTYGNVKYLGSSNNRYLMAIGVQSKTATNYQIHSNCKIISTLALSDCKSFTSITIPYGVTNIDRWAFSDCDSLTNITLPSSLKKIGENCFSGCDMLTTVNIPEGVVSLGHGAFSSCPELTNISIPNSIKKVSYGFYSCNKLVFNTYENANYLGNSSNPYLVCVNVINKDATNININNNCKIIMESAFEDCTKITDIIVPDSVTTISASAFDDCESIQSLHIGKNVSEIGGGDYGTLYIYEGKYSLASITVDSRNQYYDSRNNCNAIIEKSTNTLILGCNNTVIPNDIKSIGTYAFMYCNGINSINIPNTVTYIGTCAFYLVENLTTIYIPKSVTKIDYGAFTGCGHLTTINYAGTKKEWNSITKGEYWDEETGAYSIYCTDGIIDKA